MLSKRIKRLSNHNVLFFRIFPETVEILQNDYVTYVEAGKLIFMTIGV